MLNIYALNNIRDQKEINRYQIYKKVLKRCHHRIKTISKKGESFCFYIVPEYIYGIPKYDTLSCANFIVKKLRNNGFKILYTYPNLIFISWNHVPSEFKVSKIKDTNIKNTIDNKNKSDFRYIEDYNPSKNFLKKINGKNIKTIEY